MNPSDTSRRTFVARTARSPGLIVQPGLTEAGYKISLT
jgi:hypothetical protein